MTLFINDAAWENVLLLDKEFDDWEYAQVIEPYRNEKASTTYVSNWMHRKIAKAEKQRQEEVAAELELIKEKEEQLLEQKKKTQKRIDYVNSLDVGMFMAVDDVFASAWLNIFKFHSRFTYKTHKKDGCVYIYVTGEK